MSSFFTICFSRAVVEDLIGFGATVHTCARNGTELSQRLQEWRDLGYNVTGSVCDVSVRATREKLMEEVASLFHGKLNILVRFFFLLGFS